MKDRNVSLGDVLKAIVAIIVRNARENTGSSGGGLSFLYNFFSGMRSNCDHIVIIYTFIVTVI